MSNRTHLRNAALAALSILLVYLLASWQIPAPALAQDNLADLTVLNSPVTGNPGGLVTVNFSISSNSTVERSFAISISGLPSSFQTAVDSPIIVPAGGTVNFSVTVSIPSGQAPGELLTGRISAVAPAAGNEAAINLAEFFQIQISGNTPTPTATSTGTPAPATSTPTTGPICPDGFEPDNTFGSARPIDVQTSQQHAICPVGDEDWVVFGGIGGKTYTVDITRMDAGIDLSLELFDADGNSIAFNDDFFNRDPANPNPTDIRPRITIRIPVDGRYYVRIRDNAGRGGTDYIYIVALIDESYGPTPTQVASVCLDLFEPDGLPEQADLITSNELQQDRKLCPTGDADWITFFGKTGKRYVIFTDSRPYRGRNQVNGETQAGADTVIVLTDRDGVSVLDVNDDIPGGNTFDSEIEFIPEVDGFYFVQIKNVGDIGNQFIRYDLVLLLCLPEQTTCGRAAAPIPTAAPVGTQAPAGSPQPSATADQGFDLDPTNTPTLTPTPTVAARGQGEFALRSLPRRGL